MSDSQFDIESGPDSSDDSSYAQELLAVAIDDEPDIVDAVVELLKDFGIEVLSETDPIKGIELVRKTLPDVVILDIMMPEMDGYQFADALAADPSTSHIPIVYLTSKCIKDDLCKTFAQGGTLFVKKPFLAAELAESLRIAVSLAKTF
jgi:CheY-like chemotaxis protein